MLSCCLYFTANYIHPHDEENYKILKDLSEGTFTKSKKNALEKRKELFWRAKGKFKAIQDKPYYDEKEVSEWLCLYYTASTERLKDV